MTQFMYNNAWNEITGKMSFEVNYKYYLKVWRDSQVHESQSQKAILNIAEFKKLHTDLIKRIEGQKRQTIEIKSYEVDERIYLQTDNMQTKKKSKKLMNKSIESFMIKKNIKKLSYKLDLSQEMQIYSVFHTSMLQQCNQFISLQATSMPVELKNKYEVEEILEKRIISEEAHYLIKWKEYDALKSMWKP